MRFVLSCVSWRSSRVKCSVQVLLKDTAAGVFAFVQRYIKSLGLSRGWGWSGGDGGACFYLVDIHLALNRRRKEKYSTQVPDFS